MEDLMVQIKSFKIQFQDKRFSYTLHEDLARVLEYDSVDKKIKISLLEKIFGSQDEFDWQLKTMIEYEGVQNLWQVSKNMNFIIRMVGGKEIAHDEEEELNGLVENEVDKDIWIEVIGENELGVDIQKVNKYLKQVHLNSEVCNYFVSEGEICFQTLDQLLILYDIIGAKEKYLFTLNQDIRELKSISTLAYTLEKNQKERIIWFNKSQFTFSPQLGNVMVNWIDNLLLESQSQVIQSIEFLEDYNIGYYYMKDAKVRGEEIFTLSIASSFNYYYWSLIESIKEDGLKELSSRQFSKLLTLQLPNGRTFLNQIQFDEQNMNYLFQSFDPNTKRLRYGTQYLPILNDSLNKNAFDYYYDDLKSTSSATDRQKILDQVKKLLEHVQNYPFNLCHINIDSILKSFLDNTDDSNDMKTILDFLLARCKNLKVLNAMEKAKFNIEAHPYFVALSDSIYSESQQVLKEMMWTSSGSEQDIEAKLLDLTYFYEHLDKQKIVLLSKIFVKVIKCSDEVIKDPFIEGIVRFNWSQIQKRILIFVLAPYALFMIFFYIYTIYDLETIYEIDQSGKREYVKGERVNYIHLGYFCRAIMLSLVTYFVAIDGFQIKVIGLKKYVISLWNLVNLILYLLVYLGEILHGINKYTPNQSLDTGIKYDRVIRILYSFATLLLWTKFLYFFRVMRSTGYYIRMVIETFKDIGPFLVIFFAIVICFAQAFYIFLLNTKHDREIQALITGNDDHTFQGMYDAIVFTYLMNFGVFNNTSDYFGSYQTWISWLFSILAQITLTIVLLNFLIAIVNDTFSKIKANSHVFMQKDILTLMQENSFLFNNFFQCRKCRVRGKRIFQLRGLGWLKFLQLYREPKRFIVIGVPKQGSNFEEIMKENMMTLVKDVKDIKQYIFEMRQASLMENNR